MRPRTLRAALVGVLLVMPVGLPVPAMAATADVPTLVEAWYRTSPVDAFGEDPTCAVPNGCVVGAIPPLPADLPSPYPAMTLHVDKVGLVSTAQTFLSLDLSAVGASAQLTGGTLTLPVAEAEAGTQAPETAAILACLAIQPITAAEGGQPGGGPSFDCATSAPATFVGDATPGAQLLGEPAAFTVDLLPFVEQWSGGFPNHGLALVAAPDSTPASWHVAFSSRDRAADGAQPITASLTFTDSEPPPPPGPAAVPAPVPGAPQSAGVAPLAPPSPAGGSFTPSPPLTAPPPPASAAPPAVAGLAPEAAAAAETETAVGELAAAPPQEPVAALGPFEYAYPAVWFLPLVFIGALGGLGRSLTSEMTVPALAGTPRGPRAVAGGGPATAPATDLLTRLWAAARSLRKATTS